MKSLTQPRSPIKKGLKVIQKEFRLYGWQALVTGLVLQNQSTNIGSDLRSFKNFVSLNENQTKRNL